MTETDLVDESPPCESYQGKGKHLALTIPFLILVVMITLYLASINLIFSIIYIGFYVATNIFQAYCCVYQECPYVGKYCPAVVCLYPANFLAQLSFYKNMERTEKKFNTFVALAELSLLCFAVFPLFFLFQLGILYLVGYVIFILIYAFLFLWFICPNCAINDTCPGGIASQKLHKQSK